jgi:hypothetical protein
MKDINIPMGKTAIVLKEPQNDFYHLETRCMLIF